MASVSIALALDNLVGKGLVDSKQLAEMMGFKQSRQANRIIYHLLENKDRFISFDIDGYAKNKDGCENTIWVEMV